MAKVTIESSTANRKGFRSNKGQSLWKIGANYVLCYKDSDLNSLIYRYSSDGTTWSSDITLFSVGSNYSLAEFATWYSYIGTSHILYVVYKEAGYSTTYIKIAKFNLDTITTPTQIGSTYNITTGISWSPLYHNRLSLAADNYLWLCGTTYDSAGSPYHEYYTVKASNTISATGDTDINSWGTPLLIADNAEGYNKEYGAQCILAGSRTSAKMLFAYISWSASNSCRLRLRYGDGGNADSNWSPAPSVGEGNYVENIYENYITDRWLEGTGVISYSPSALSDIIWITDIIDSLYDIRIHRVDIANQNIIYTTITGTFYYHWNNICCVTRGIDDTIFIPRDRNYNISTFQEHISSQTYSGDLDNVGITSHNYVIMPLWAESESDVFVIYTDV